MTTTQITRHMDKLITAAEAAGFTATITDREGKAAQIDISRGDAVLGQARWVRVHNEMRFDSGHMVVGDYVQSARSTARMLLLVEVAGR